MLRPGLVVSDDETQKAFFKANKKHIEHGQIIPVGSWLPARAAWKAILEQTPQDTLKSLLDEARKRWLAQMQDLLASIEGRKILFWFSVRSPDYQEEFSSITNLFSDFPQLINREMVEHLKDFADDYVEVVSSVGMPVSLPELPLGKDYPQVVPDGINLQYPSQDMHVVAASELAKVMLG